MKRLTIIALIVLLIAGLFVACDQDKIADDEFDSKVTITFDANGGTGTMAPITVKRGTVVKLPAVEFTYEGYVFVGWEDKDEKDYKDKEIITPNTDLVLYAQWMEFEYINSSTTNMTPGKAYVTKDATTTIADRITVAGDSDEAVFLILSKDTTLNANSGISVEEGSKLLIQGSGTLNATGTGKDSGIGGGAFKDGGVITIEGGTITATGGEGAAGIGGGKEGKGGIINLEGGKITATGGEGGAGIGGGSTKGSETIVISGGEITSNGGTDSAGIGGGAGGEDGGTIIISGGDTKATGNGDGAGIGGGKNGKSGTIKIGKTDVGEPKIEAVGGEGTGNPNGIGKGVGATGDDEIVLLDMRLKCAPDTTGYWELYDTVTPNPAKYMATLNNDVTVTFNANNGTGSMPVQVIPAGTPTPLAENTFTRTDHVFKGWATSASGEVVYTDKASATLSQDTVLYANWEVSHITPFPTTEPVVLAGGTTYQTATGTTTLTQRVRISGTEPVTIIVSKDSTLDTKGITVISGQKLIINTEDNSKLIADAEHASGYMMCQFAGIGGEEVEYKTCGTIEINGTGTVIATGGEDGGSGIGGSLGEDCGEITINGGTIIATASANGAGIGGGNGKITINGGDITAKGFGGGAGIGGRPYESGGIISIHGGTIVATGDDGGAGIGGGCGTGYEGKGASGKITVDNTKSKPIIYAVGGKISSVDGDGIGRGANSDAERDITYSGVTLQYRTTTTGAWSPISVLSNGRYGRTEGTVKVKFDGNGATSGSMSDMTIEIGDTTTLTKNDFANDSKYYMGWNTSSDGTGEAYGDEAEVSGLKNLTLYAQWTVPTPIPASVVSSCTLEGGMAYEISGYTDFTQRVRINGNAPVMLYLKSGTYTVAEKGITVSKGQTLIINADDNTASLKADAKEGWFSGAGIGGESFGEGTTPTNGTVIINGGTITAKGNDNCAGIGGARYGAGGTITITGGVINATGVEEGAGIGGGEYMDDFVGYGAKITISGGKVTASNITGSSGHPTGAGIGGGRYGEGGTIKICGNADVTATANFGASGIGGGENGVGGTITISDTAKVTATGGIAGGAGIGGGRYLSGTTGSGADGGTITISGGVTVYAKGGNREQDSAAGAGIGGGGGTKGFSGTITISKVGDAAPKIYAVAGTSTNETKAQGIGNGETATGPEALEIIHLEGGVELWMDDDGAGDDWTSSDGSTSQRKVYMKTTGAVPPTT